MKGTTRFTLVTAACCIVYLAWVFGSRWLDRRAAEERARLRVNPLPAALNTSDLKVLHFYASPNAIRAGERALLCYGVLNAEAVRIEPPVAPLAPSLTRCIEVRPERSTEYRLVARSGSREVAAVAAVAVGR